MRVIVPPVIVDGKVCRIVAPVSSHIEVQEWAGEYWLPSDVLFLAVSAAPRASEMYLRRQGVPKRDCMGPAEIDVAVMTEAMLIALVAASMHMDDTADAHTAFIGEWDGGPSTRFRKQYPGSKRFRRAAQRPPSQS